MIMLISYQIQNKSSYGLFGKESISIQPSGRYVELPYYRNCLYVAYMALDTNPVSK